MSAMNPMGLSPVSAAGITSNVSAAGQIPPEDMPVEPNPAEFGIQKFGEQFLAAWEGLKSLNSEYSGDAELFRNLEKAAEAWFADLASKLPETASTSSNSSY